MSNTDLAAWRTTLESDPDLLARTVGRIWVKFGNLYGARWTEAGNNRDAWALELAEFTMPAIEYAVKQSEKQFAEWPPTLATFKGFCRQILAPSEIRSRGPKLERKRSEPETAKKHLAEIGKQLGLK